MKNQQKIPHYLDLKEKDENILDIWVLSCDTAERLTIEGEDAPQDLKKEDLLYPLFFLCWVKNCSKVLAPRDLEAFLEKPTAQEKKWTPQVLEENYRKLHEKNPRLLAALKYSFLLYKKFPQIWKTVSPSQLVIFWSYFPQVFNPGMSEEVNNHAKENYRQLIDERLPHAKKRFGEDISTDFSPPKPPPSPPLPQPEQIPLPPLELKSYESQEETCQEIIGSIRISRASSIGPKYAQKAENQDATFFFGSPLGVVFALADGVGTSMGASLAAKIAVKEFCHYMVRQTNPGAPPGELLQAAALHVQQHLTGLLENIMPRIKEQEFAGIRGNIPPETAYRLCRNTLIPERRHWGPVLSTTLMGGLIRKLPEEYEIYILRIGDGIAEHYRKNNSKNEVLSYFDVDRDEMLITSSLCPGLPGESSVEKAEVRGPYQLNPGDFLLISSDGLARGHSDKVWEKLKKINIDCQQTPAANVIDQVIRYTNGAGSDVMGPDQLFNDNLSLILINLTDTA